MSIQPDEGHVVLMHQNGAKRAEGMKINGRAHGSWTFWYDNGAVMQVGSYDEDLPHGRWIYYWRNHNKQREGTYECGRRTGFWSGWHINGTMSECGEYKDDRENGFWQYWDENEQITSEGDYVSGVRHGSWRFQGKIPGVTFITEWYQDELTNVPGQQARQVSKHRGLYYPVVPGQLPGQITPFANPGSASGVYFGCVTGARGIQEGAGPFTYLFEPAAPINETEAAGLFLAIWLRYSHLYIMERLYTAFPDIPISRHFPRPVSEPLQYVVLSDPLITGIRENQHRSLYETLDEAITVAQMVADEWGYTTVVSGQVFDYPLDI